MRLVATSGDQMLSFPIRQGSTLIGRHPSCHVCIPAKGLSRRHCQCFVDGPTVILRDLGSSNGTFVNNQRVERTELHDGDVISMGGFQLRFDAEGMGSPPGSYSQTVEPTQGVVVAPEPQEPPADDQPREVVVEGGPPPDEPFPGPQAEPAGPQPEEGVPPPTDFPESPEGDETPVDNAFVPAPYSPGGQSFGLAQQPQLVVRDGRWFLRDPRTGREVEIAPSGGAAAAAPPVETRRPNVRLLVAVVAGAAILVFAFAFFGLRGPGRPTNGGQRFPTAEYNRIVDAAVASIRKADEEQEPEKRKALLADALTKLELANSKRTDLSAARLLAQYIRLRIDAGGDLEKFNWREARNYLESITNSFSVSDETIAFVKEAIRQIDYEQTCIGRAEEAIAKLADGDSVEILMEIQNALARLPEDCWARTRYEPKRLELRGRVAQFYLARARQAMDQRRWADAIKQFDEAIPHVDDRAPIQAQKAICQRNIRDAQLLDDAKQDLRQDNFDAARRALQRIAADGPYGADAKSLLARIDTLVAQRAQQALHKRVEDLYQAGAGDEAAKLIKQHGLQDLAFIPQRVAQIQQLVAAGQKAEKAKNFEEALKVYQQAVEVETNAKNAYRRRAEGLLDDLKARFPQIAADFANEGYRRIDTDAVQARKLFTRSLRFDPEQPRARSGLEQLQRSAAFVYNQAQQFLKAKDFAKARDAFRRALDRANPGSELYNRIKQAIEQLPD